MPAAGRIASDIKRYNQEIPVAMGGVHPSALPERTLGEEDIDFVIQGEGPYTIAGLIKYLKGKMRIEDVQGLWFKDKDLIRSNSPAAVVKNLDQELDNYAWDLLPGIGNYRAHNMHCFQDFSKSKMDDFSDIRSPYVSLNTSLGCPYSCHYCCINAVFGAPGMRRWSLEKVISWFDTLINKFQVRNIRLDDELFILSNERVEKFCDMIIERGYDVNIWVYGRVDTINKSLLDKMKKAGINWVCLGIESGNDSVRSSVNKRIKSDIKSVVRDLQSRQINVLGNFMFGLPEDNMTTMRQTLELAMELNCEFANFYSVMAYPGSRLYESSANGDSPKKWESFSQHSYETFPLATKYLSAKDVLRFRDEAFYQYHSNPKYLEMLEKKFGDKVRKHIEKMLSIKVRRRLLEN
jgi:radical SAM superfamily enzyme YgiQ (UPF0313 family)